MFNGKKGLILAGLAGALFFSTGCNEMVVTSDRYSEMERIKEATERENEALLRKVSQEARWRRGLLKFEQKISNLEAIMAPLSPLQDKNMALMNANNREGEEAGGGSQTEIFYLVQSSYSELELHSANIANEIATDFDKDDFVKSYLFDKLEDKVFDVNMEIAEITLRRSSHMATDRRLVTARLKAVNECFQALRLLWENKAFELTYNQKVSLLGKLDLLRMEYAKTLKTDYFPAIPHFIPIASGADYLKSLDGMNDFVTASSVFFENPNAPAASNVKAELGQDLDKKTKLLKSGTIQ